MEYGRGHTKREETYVFLKYEDGYSEKEKEVLRSEVRDWCQYDKKGCTMVLKSYPNLRMLGLKTSSKRSKHEQIIHQENFIESELGINKMK